MGESAAEKQERLWAQILAANASSAPQPAGRTYPDYTTVLSHVQNADYSDILRCPLDTRTPQQGPAAQGNAAEKTLCPHGAAATCRLEWFPGVQERYTGLFAGAEAGLVRLSSAIEPPAAGVTSVMGRMMLRTLGSKLREAQIFPCVAIKVFRGAGSPSGNLLFGGCKTGQAELDFFAHCLCTNMTERVSAPLRYIIRLFRRYSEHPLSLGISEFASVTQEGDSVEEPEFPYCIILRPVQKLLSFQQPTTSQPPPDSNGAAFDGFIEDLKSIPTGTVLYDIFACPEPRDATDASKLERLGRVVSTSEFIPSGPGDGLFFKHQAKEEDLALRPEWEGQLRLPCPLDGKAAATGDTIARLAGWELFEHLIGEGSFRDFGAVI